jgi:hypothetical protein
MDMTTSRVIDINVGDFSKTPYGRHAADGKHSGERFRETVLRQHFENQAVSIINVHLDTLAEGYEYGSGFLEEAFGGLIRICGIPMAVVEQKLRLISKHQDDVEDIVSYIRAAG